MDTVTEMARCMDVNGRETVEGDEDRGFHHLRMGGRDFIPQGQGANLFISLQVTMKFY